MKVPYDDWLAVFVINSIVLNIKFTKVCEQFSFALRHKIPAHSTVPLGQFPQHTGPTPVVVYLQLG